MKTRIDTGKPVWWELFPGAAVCAIDTRKRRFFGIFALIFYRDLDGLWNSRWVRASDLIERS